MNKMQKKFINCGLVIMASFYLLGCEYREVGSNSASDVDATTFATSVHGTTPEALAWAMSPDGAWVFSMQDDITVEGPLIIDGYVPRHDGGRFIDVYARLIALFYRSGRYGSPEGRFNLTVTEGIHSYAYRTWLHGVIDEAGNPSHIYGDVYINHYGFHLRDVIIHGNLTFATSSIKYWAGANFWNRETYEMDSVAFEDVVTGEVRVASAQ
ncbi:MAG: hypothetical protein FWF59_09060 [Turicibacter sp.]|nr:hypothetical protein [Turicibacter sp.]